jgi:hypothetical protein
MKIRKLELKETKFLESRGHWGKSEKESAFK